MFFKDASMDLYDRNGKEICVGDMVCTDNGHIGIVSFGVYAERHCGVHIMWKEYALCDVNALRI